DGKPPTGDLFVLDLDEGRSRQLNPKALTLFVEPDFGASAELSPDGTTVAFTASDGAEKLGIYTIGLDGKRLRQLADVSVAQEARWSPNGEWIAFAAQQGDGFVLTVAHPDGTAVHPVAQTRIAPCCIAWSP